jgi:Predicted DNA-binding protein with PD1-like DNA-binding motif
MEYNAVKLGRIFVLRLHQGERIDEVIEKFSNDKQIKSGLCFFLGGIEDQSKIVAGPKDGKAMPPDPMIALLKGVHEGVGVGTIFSDESNKPKLHMHASFGRNETASTGCIRAGVLVWQVGEVVILELSGGQPRRVKDKATGFEVLQLP